MSINGWMSKENAAYTHDGILFSHKKEWSIDRCYNMVEPQNHYVKWNKADTKHHILYDPIYKKYSDKVNP